MPVAALAAPLIGGGMSMLSGLFGGSKQTTQQQPTYTANQTNMQGDLFGWLKNQMMNPNPMTAQKNAAAGNINKGYATTENNVTNALTSRGFGSSGKVGTNLQQIELGRQGALAGNEANFAQLEQNQQNFDMDEAMKYAFSTPGSNSTTTASSNPIGAGVQTGTFLYALNNMMGNNNSGGGGGGSVGGGYNGFTGPTQAGDPGMLLSDGGG